MKNKEDLRKQLKMLDQKSYGMYQTLRGTYHFDNYTLCIDHVQGDPFAAPSRVRVCIEQQKHRIPPSCYDRKCKKIALEDYLLRQFNKNIDLFQKRSDGSGNSGRLLTCACYQEVLERIAVLVDEKQLEARMEIGFPARGRSIAADELEDILFHILPKIMEKSFWYDNLNWKHVERSVNLAEDQESLRLQIKDAGFCSFVANGSMLPRESGVSEKPMKKGVLFESPKSLVTEFTLPHKGVIKGMGIKEGITLIVGGGYHGKSTLLKAVELGVYNHIYGDGREYVITDETGLKIRAEDGRSIKGSNISPFINHLPNKQNTEWFSTENASGSTSQAAGIVEGIEAGTKLFLIDEDTSATNFMVRDDIMSSLVSDEKEPITPFIRKVESLFHDRGVSTILVVGSSGAYLSVADTVIQMDNYIPCDVTENAKKICAEHKIESERSVFPPLSFTRVIGKSEGKRKSVKSQDKRGKIKVHGKDSLVMNKETIDLRCLEQITDMGQIIALGYFMNDNLEQIADGQKTMRESADILYKKLMKDGLLSLIPSGYYAGHPVFPRKQEFFQCMNRYRSLNIQNKMPRQTEAQDRKKQNIQTK